VAYIQMLNEVLISALNNTASPTSNCCAASAVRHPWRPEAKLPADYCKPPACEPFNLIFLLFL